MARKKFFLVVDTETTQTDMVADFGAVVCDKQGNIVKEIGVLTEYFNDKEKHPLFHMGDFMGGKANLPKRYKRYNDMVTRGDRVLAYTGAINIWLARANAEYRPILTAYNIAFDSAKWICFQSAFAFGTLQCVNGRSPASISNLFLTITCLIIGLNMAT